MGDATIQSSAPTRLPQLQDLDKSTIVTDAAVMGGPVSGTTTVSPAVGTAVMDSVGKLSTKAMPAAPVLEAPTVTDPTAVGQANSNITAIAQEFFPPETVALLTSANNKIMDPANTDPSVVAAREMMTSIGTTMLSVISASSDDSINQFVSTTLAKNGIKDVPPVNTGNVSSVNYQDLGSALAMVALFSQMPSLEGKSTQTQLEALQKKAESITVQIGKDLKEAQKAARKAEEAAEKAKKESKTSSIFGWIATGLTLLAGAALVATGVGTAAGVGLLVVGSLMAANQIMSSTGVYDKVPALGKAMAYIIPIATAAVAIGAAAFTGGSSLLLIGGAVLTTAGSATQITDQALKDTGEIEEGGTADQVMSYTGMGLQLAGGLTSAGGAAKSVASGGAAAAEGAEAAGEAAEGASKGTSSIKKIGTAISATSRILSGTSEIAGGAFQISSGMKNLEVAELQKQLTTVQAQIQELQTQSDTTQQLESSLVKIFQQLNEQNADTSQTVMQTIATAGEGTMAIASSIGQTSTTA